MREERHNGTTAQRRNGIKDEVEVEVKVKVKVEVEVEVEVEE